MSVFRRFLGDPSGAVTVDWVVLAGSVVGLGLGAAVSVRSGTSALGADIDTGLTRAAVAGANLIAGGLFTPAAGTQGIWAMGWGYDTDASYDLGEWDRTDINYGVQYINSGNYIGVTSLSGGMMIDMGYGGLTTLARTLDAAQDGQTYTVSVTAADPLFSYSPGQREGVNNRLEVWYGGQQVGTIDPESAGMGVYDFQVTGGMGDGTNRLELRARQDGSHVLGVFLEDVNVHS